MNRALGSVRPIYFVALATLLVAACSGGAPDGGTRAPRSMGAPSTTASSATSTPQAAETGVASEAPSTKHRHELGEAPVPAPPGSPPRRVTIAATGDILVHSRVADAGSLPGGGYDFTPLLDGVRAQVASADVAICHLENPLTPDGRVSGYPVFSAPAQLADAIAATGWDTCSVASNHILDRGAAGVDSTLQHLDRVGVRHAGAARDREEAERPTLVPTPIGVTIGHVSATYGLNGFRPDAPWRVDLLDPSPVTQRAGAARAAGADLVVASLHWGAEFQRQPTAEQVRLAETILSSGEVDIVVGHHAHVVQPLGWISGHPVAYGLGNLLANMPSRLEAGAMDGVVLAITAEIQADGRPAIVSVRPHPTFTDPKTLQVRLVGPEHPAAQRTLSTLSGWELPTE